MNLLFVTKQTHVDVNGDDPSSYLGVWKSAGGFIRQELLADGTYVKRKGSRPTVTGRYAIGDGHIAYESNDGHAWAGEFTQGRLHQAGMIFYKVN